MTAEYIRITGDYKILETEESFLEDEILKEFEDERYRKPMNVCKFQHLYMIIV